MLLNGAELQAMLDDPDLVLLHVGHGRLAYDRRGHLPGAVFVDIEDLLDEEADYPDRQIGRAELVAWCRSVGIDGDRPQRIVLYGEASGLFAARVFATLSTLGLADRMSLLDGHLRRWVAEDRPMEVGGVQAVPTDWVPGKVSTLEATYDRVAHGVDVEGWSLVDARLARNYHGQQLGRPELLEAGHIPGAVSVPWQGLIGSIKDPSLRPVSELRAMFAEVDASRPVAAYCATGMQSSVTFFVLRYLGYDAVWYDGSLVDWQRRGGSTTRTVKIP
ncbi:MAG: rhodanese-like domain-containing protein [Planctomycetota bacterium]